MWKSTVVLERRKEASVMASKTAVLPNSDVAILRRLVSETHELIVDFLARIDLN